MMRRRRAHLTWIFASLFGCAGILLGGGAAFGYAGEPGSGDGPDPAYQNLTVSTHHTHLTRALAYCAGLPGLLEVRNPVNPLLSQKAAQLAEIIGLNDELTDQGTITGTATGGPVWTNITPSDQWTPPHTPTSKELGCGADLKMVYPVLAGTQPSFLPAEQFWDPNVGWFTNRFGPWVGQFHFPELADVDTLRKFAMAETTTLNARSLYAFGGSNFYQAACYPPAQTQVIATGNMKPGSVEAFATYLHSVGDYHSHGVCRKSWASGPHTPPWVYHTPAVPQTLWVKGCAFNDHSLEFGCPNSDWRANFVQGTVEGGVDVFNELVKYAQTKGYSPRVPSVESHAKWLHRQLQRYAILFETNVNKQAGACRVSYTYALMKACDAAAKTDPNSCLPDVAVQDGGGCDSKGQTSGCENGTAFFPVTASCTSTAPKAAP